MGLGAKTLRGPFMSEVEMKNKSSYMNPKGAKKAPRPTSKSGPLTTTNATGTDGKPINVPSPGLGK